MSEARYEVEFTAAASRQFRKLDKQPQARIKQAVDELKINPRHLGVIKLTGRDAYRVRVGDYRVIFEIEDGRLLITVLRIGSRRDVSESLR